MFLRYVVVKKPHMVQYSFKSISSMIMDDVDKGKRKDRLQFSLMILFNNGRQLFFLLETQRNGSIIGHCPYKEAPIILGEIDFEDMLKILTEETQNLSHNYVKTIALSRIVPLKNEEAFKDNRNPLTILMEKCLTQNTAIQ